MSPLVVESALKFKQSLIVCVAEDLDASRITMQEIIWRYLPPGIQALNNKKDPRGVFNIRYSRKGGFTEESLVLQRHPEVGYRILSSIKFLKGAAQLVLHHHEQYDGNGYPQHLKGAAIDAGARGHELIGPLGIELEKRIPRLIPLTDRFHSGASGRRHS